MGRLAIFLTATTLLSCSADRSNDRIGSHLADATRTVSERVGLTLPAADTPLSLRDPGSGVAVAVRLIDATDGDLMQRRTAEGTEDFLLFDQPLPDATLRYRLVLSDAVAGLRLVAEQLELLDEGGAPRLRVKPPFVIDADGRRHAAHLALPDCASDHDPRAPQGRPVTAAGATSCTLRLAWAEGLPHPLLVDPFWTLTGSLAQARIVHTSSLLPDGKVLAMGGWDLVTTFASAEIYDPVTETWSAAASMKGARHRHTATTLSDGRVLVVGGLEGLDAVATTELYDPTSGTWSDGPPLGEARYNHTATLLPDGRVVVAGGFHTAPIASAEIYDPLVGTFSALPALAAARSEHVATRLPNGKVLVAGGLGTAPLASAELFDPTTDSWSSAGSMTSPRVQHTATLLTAGDVLVIGGYDQEDLFTSERYDPIAGTWTATGNTTYAWRQHTASELADGLVIVAGGWTDAELYDPATGTWSITGNLSTPRRYHTAHRFADGRVIVVAGRGNAGPLASVEVFSPLGNYGDPCVLHSECAYDNCVDGVCCDGPCAGGDPLDCEACNLPGLEGTCSLSPAGAACGSAEDVACTAPDTCDGNGACLANDEPEGASCGDQGMSCHLDDGCDGQGICLDAGLAPDGSPCPGGVCLDGECSGGSGGGGTGGGGGEATGGGGTGGGDETGGGCGCTLEPRPNPTDGWALLALGALLAARRRQLALKS